MTSWKSPEAAAWRARLDAVPLTRLTAEAVNKRKAERIAAHSSDPVKRRSAIVTAGVIVRMARAVFSEKILAAGLGKVVNLPTPLPFAGVVRELPQPPVAPRLPVVFGDADTPL